MRIIIAAAFCGFPWLLLRASAPEIQKAAEDAARKVLESLNYVGVLAIEFFECDGKLLANEMAPRVHNSGHWTIEGAVTSQFENHLAGHLRVAIGFHDCDWGFRDDQSHRGGPRIGPGAGRSLPRIFIFTAKSLARGANLGM